MFIKMSELQPGNRFRLLSPLGLPDGKGWRLEWEKGGIYCCHVDNDLIVETRYFNDPDLEVFRESEYQLDV